MEKSSRKAILIGRLKNLKKKKRYGVSDPTNGNKHGSCMKNKRILYRFKFIVDNILINDIIYFNILFVNTKEYF